MLTEIHDRQAVLAAQWQELSAREPSTRLRDAAKAMGVSEVELVAAGCAGVAQRLTQDWPGIVAQLESLGKVKAITRNDAAVHEVVGQFGNVEISGDMGQVVTDHIDLRLFLRSWQFVFAVEGSAEGGSLRSIQFFDRYGQAVHKVYLTQYSDVGAWSALRDDFAAQDTSAEAAASGASADVSPDTVPAPAPEREDTTVDVSALREGWLGLASTHLFNGFLREHAVSRTQAFRLAGTDLARRIDRTAPAQLLENVAASGQEVMIFVGNRGCLQIHSGPLRTLKRSQGWFNVMDPEFTLHLREDLVDSVWVVRKPTRTGPVTSMELYDGAGENIAIIFAKRPHGAAEPEAWGALLDGFGSHVAGGGINGDAGV